MSSSPKRQGWPRTTLQSAPNTSSSSAANAGNSNAAVATSAGVSSQRSSPKRQASRALLGIAKPTLLQQSATDVNLNSGRRSGKDRQRSGDNEKASEYATDRYDWSRQPSFRLSRLFASGVSKSSAAVPRQPSKAGSGVAAGAARAPSDGGIDRQNISGTGTGTAASDANTRDDAYYSTRDIDDILLELKSDKDRGLSIVEVTRRHELYGLNELHQEKKSNILIQFLQQFTDVVVLLLLAASIVSLAIQEYVEGAAILVIVTVNAVIAVYTERQSGNAIEALTSLSAPTSRCLRDGKWMDGIPSKELTIGDVVQVRMGEIIPADMRLIEVEHLKVSETPLTGESNDVKKNAERVRTEESINTAEEEHSTTESINNKPPPKKKEEDNNTLTPANCVFSSCSATEGSAIGVVIAVGMNTHVGRIAALLEGSDDDGDVETENSEQSQSAASSRRSSRAAAERSRSVRLDVKEEGVDNSNKAADPTAVAGAPTGEGAGDNTGNASDTEPDDDGDAANGSGSKRKKKRSIGHRIKAKLGMRTKQTPLQRSIGKLGTYMGLVGVAAAILVFAIGLGRNHKDPDYRDSPVWLQMLLVSVSLAVGVIPEGLPIVTTICLALGSSRLAKKKALIRELPAVEALSAATVICTDKTGTLTQSIMTAIKLWTAKQDMELQKQQDVVVEKTAEADADTTTQPKSQRQASTSSPLRSSAAAQQTLTVAALCNNAEFGHDGKPNGNATDCALLGAAAKHTDLKTLLDAYERVDEIAFTSARKMHVTVHKLGNKFNTSSSAYNSLPFKLSSNQYMICFKGAPNFVLAIPPSQMLSSDDDSGNGKISTASMDESMRNEVLEQVDRYSDHALRVIGMAYAIVDKLPYKLPVKGDDNAAAAADDEEMSGDEKLALMQKVDNLTFAGIVGIMDPEREGVADAVEQAKSAGIKTIMITGDYLKTAIAIGRRIRLLPATGDVSRNATDCSALRTENGYQDETVIDDITSFVVVFARAKPEDKLVIVKSLQRQGHIAGMTGDGVNDAPALKQADVGIAMGITGTDVAKGASKVILVDDNFVTIVHAVENGRIIYSNIQKFVTFLVGVNSVSVILIFLSVCIGLPLPFVALQLLFINLVVEGLPALALSTEEGEEGMMNQPPREPDEFLITFDRFVMIVLHSLALASASLVVFLVGLYWEVGYVISDNIPYNDATQEYTCKEFSPDGGFQTIVSTGCATTAVEVARTMTFFTLIVSENFRAYTVRYTHTPFWHRPFYNRWLLLATTISVSAVMLVIWVPGLDDIFHTNAQAMKWYEWLLCVAAASITVLVDEAYKTYLRIQFKKKQAQQKQMLHDERHKSVDKQSSLTDGVTSDKSSAGKSNADIVIQMYDEDDEKISKNVDDKSSTSECIHTKSPSFNNSTGPSSSTSSMRYSSPVTTHSNTLQLPQRGGSRETTGGASTDDSPQPFELSRNTTAE